MEYTLFLAIVRDASLLSWAVLLLPQWLASHSNSSLPGGCRMVVVRMRIIGMDAARHPAGSMPAGSSPAGSMPPGRHGMGNTKPVPPRQGMSDHGTIRPHHGPHHSPSNRWPAPMNKGTMPQRSQDRMDCPTIKRMPTIEWNHPSAPNPVMPQIRMVTHPPARVIEAIPRRHTDPPPVKVRLIGKHRRWRSISKVSRRIHGYV